MAVLSADDTRTHAYRFETSIGLFLSTSPHNQLSQHLYCIIFVFLVIISMKYSRPVRRTIMKIKPLVMAAVLCLALTAGCTKPEPAARSSPSLIPSPSPSPAVTVSPKASPSPDDAVSSASLVNTAVLFEKAVSKNGVWIICLLNDLTIDKALVVDGDFKNNKTPPVSQRKIALYEQDENRTVTARYTLTVPQMTINSIDCSIQHGTFRGDLHVAGKNFQLVDTTVDGNIYFLNAEAQSSFKMDDTSKVTGVTKLKTS